MKYLTIAFLLIATTAFASDKGWNLSVDKSTGEIVEMTYGDSGFQHRIDAGYTVIRRVPSRVIANNAMQDLKWGDLNGDLQVQRREIFRRPQSQITTRRNAKKRLRLRKRLVGVHIKKDKADALGFTNVSQDLQRQIDNINSEMP